MTCADENTSSNGPHRPVHDPKFGRSAWIKQLTPPIVADGQVVFGKKKSKEYGDKLGEKQI